MGLPKAGASIRSLGRVYEPPQEKVCKALIGAKEKPLECR